MTVTLVLENLEMSLSWVKMSPKSNNEFLYKRRKKEKAGEKGM